MYKKGAKRYKKNIFSKWRRAAVNYFVAEPKTIHKKDYAWKQDNYHSPKPKQKLSLKKKIEIIILFASLLALLATVIYHPFFYIKNIEVCGLQRINKAEFIDSVYGILDYRKFFIFPGKSYAFANVNEIKNILKEKYPIESIVVEKSFPQNILINLEEKISTIIYDNGKKYAYLGLDGKLVEVLKNIGENEWVPVNEINTASTTEETIELIHKPAVEKITQEFGLYPIIYDSSGQEIESNKKILKEGIIQGTIDWFNYANKKDELSFGYILIDNELGEGTIVMQDGWKLKVNLTERFNEQIDELDLLLKEKVNPPNLNYIDLRYPNRVYWQ